MKVVTFLIIILGMCGSLLADTIPPAIINDVVSPSDVEMKPAVEDASFIVYYFHGNRRCASCIKIENYTHAAVEENFASRLKDSSIVWKLVNTDDEANKHFLADYELYTKSVVLSKIVDGKETAWKHLDKVWEMLDDEAEFKKYIATELEAFLK